MSCTVSPKINAWTSPPQQRSINATTPRQIVREWPHSGPWGVILAIAKDSSSSCLLPTGEHDPNTGALYLWGLRRNRGNTGLIIIDKNRQAVAADTIKVLIDGIAIAAYPISQRFEDGEAHTVWAEIPQRAVDTISKLLRVGGAIKFTTERNLFDLA